MLSFISIKGYFKILFHLYSGNKTLILIYESSVPINGKINSRLSLRIVSQKRIPNVDLRPFHLPPRPRNHPPNIIYIHRYKNPFSLLARKEKTCRRVNWARHIERHLHYPAIINIWLAYFSRRAFRICFDPLAFQHPRQIYNDIQDNVYFNFIYIYIYKFRKSHYLANIFYKFVDFFLTV